MLVGLLVLGAIAAVVGWIARLSGWRFALRRLAGLVLVVVAVTFATTALLADGLKPRPPYSSGIIMPKKRSLFRKLHTSGGRSRRWKTCQSSVISQARSTGPARNASSSWLSPAYGCSPRRSKSGRPENSSASTQTVPASIASFSVLEIAGSRSSAFIVRRTRALTARRRNGRWKIAARSATGIQSQTGAARP